MAQDIKSVKITNAGLHESPLRGGTIILRGVLDADSLKQLRCDDYQREALPMTSLKKLMAAVKAGEALPDIEIGMRGAHTRSVKDDWYLQDYCYIIDGQQRVNACINTLAMFPGTPVYLGAAVHFNTDKPWERERFRILNADRVKVSPNILLRNMREDHPVIATIYGLTNSTEEAFCLGGKVSWDQNMRRGKLITALNVLKIMARLHAHIGPAQATRIDDLALQLDTMAERATLSRLRDNVRVFFDTIDDVWGIRSVQYRELATHLAGGFLYMMARVFSNHLDFWRDAQGWRLAVDIDWKRKMKTFPLTDPGIAPLASSAGASRNILYGYMIRHLNSGKRTKHLQPRPEMFMCDDEATEPETADTPPLVASATE